MVGKQVGLKTRRSGKTARGAVEEERRNTEARRVIAEEGRERAEGARRAAADDVQKEEDQRKVMEELRRSAEDMRQTAEKIRHASMFSIELQERMREAAELIRVDQIHKLIEEGRQSINNLNQKATSQLKQMEEISKSTKRIFHAMQKMLQRVSKLSK